MRQFVELLLSHAINAPGRLRITTLGLILILLVVALALFKAPAVFVAAIALFKAPAVFGTGLFAGRIWKVLTRWKK